MGKTCPQHCFRGGGWGIIKQGGEGDGRSDTVEEEEEED